MAMRALGFEPKKAGAVGLLASCLKLALASTKRLGLFRWCLPSQST